MEIEQQYFTYAIILVGVFTAYMAIVNMVRRDKLRERVLGALGGNSDDEDDKDSTPLFASFCAGVLRLFGIDVRQQKEITLLLAQAGINSPYAVHYFLFFKKIMQPIIALAGLAVVVKLALISKPIPFMNKLFWIALAGALLVIGFFGAQLYVTNTRQRWHKILLHSFPEVLDLLLVCIESGLGMDAALSRVCKEMRATHPEVASELDRARIELTMMSDRARALQNLAERTGIVPFKSLVAALIQTEKFGTSLLDTLRVLSDDLRQARLLNAENKAARIPVLITIPLILCMLPAFLMIVLGPPFVRVVEQGGIFGEKHSGGR